MKIAGPRRIRQNDKRRARRRAADRRSHARVVSPFSPRPPLNAAVPLILGIWGGKGQGKSFQTELAFRKLGVEAVVMSAGELEHERAGEPGR